MTVTASLGLRNAVLTTGSVKSVMNLGFIRIYGGAVPVDADAALGTAQLLCVISNNDTGIGLTLGTAVAAAVPKSSTETWAGTVSLGGTATFYRHVLSTDTGAAGTQQPRLQGTVGATGSGADMTAPSAAMNLGALRVITNYAITMPAF